MSDVNTVTLAYVTHVSGDLVVSENMAFNREFHDSVRHSMLLY